MRLGVPPPSGGAKSSDCQPGEAVAELARSLERPPGEPVGIELMMPFIALATPPALAAGPRDGLTGNGWGLLVMSDGPEETDFGAIEVR